MAVRAAGWSQAGLGGRRRSSHARRPAHGASRQVKAAAVVAPAPAGAVPFSAETARTVSEQPVSLRMDSSAEGDVVVTLECPALAAHTPVGLQLHWAVAAESGEWELPPVEAWPENSSAFGDGIAVRTPLSGDGRLCVRFAGGSGRFERLVGIIVAPGADEEWLHASDGGGDLAVALKPPDRSGAVISQRAADVECGDGMNLFRRFCMAQEALHGDVILSGSEGAAAALLAWLRLSSTRQLTWYNGHNYQGKDMAHVQESLAEAVAAASRDENMEPRGRSALRLALATLPRGGGNGDDIRMGILHIMRDHGIKEGHRPGIEDPFIEQWHQKLHSNTTSDDVHICKAYLHFLHTGNWDDFWGHLYDNAGLTRDDLANMKAGWKSDGIHGPAFHMPQLIPAFQHYLWILQQTHSGAGLHDAVTMARGQLDGDLQWNLDDLLQNIDEWWVPGKVVEIRHKLKDAWQSRDTAILDIALEEFFRGKVEAMDLGAMAPDDLCSTLELVLESGCIAGNSESLNNALALWRRVLAEPDRWSNRWALIADAALETVSFALEDELDGLCSLVQPHADRIGRAAGVSDAYLLNFGEEVVRGHPLFVMSGLLATLQPKVASAAGRPPYQIVSSGAATPLPGKVLVKNLSLLQGEDLSADPAVVLSPALGGLEDVPPGVRAVITSAPVDVLSHIAIRARNCGVLLASCGPAEWAKLLESDGTFVTPRVVDGAVVLESGAAACPVPADVAQVATPTITLEPPNLNTAEWMVGPEGYAKGVVGGKSQGLARLAAMAASAGVNVPASKALPFGTFEKVLGSVMAESQLKLALANLELAQLQSGPAEVRAMLAKVRKVVSGLGPPPQELVSAAAAAGINLAAPEVWQAVTNVWASKWTERAYLSRQACGITEDSLHMAVLLMDVLPADYSFVLHTANPLPTGDPDEVWGEVVVGMGEVLVGNEPGRAMSFTASKRDGTVSVHSLPSKPYALRASSAVSSLIARSDSNGEDLEAFAGAGLYDSVTTVPLTRVAVDYTSERLLWDDEFRNGIIQRLVGIATAVEAGAGGQPQDIEGVVVGGEVHLVQARAQQVA